MERPLRLNFQASPERIVRFDEESAFKNLAVSEKKETKARTAEEAEDRSRQQAIREMLGTLPATFFKDRDLFLAALEKATLNWLE